MTEWEEAQAKVRAIHAGAMRLLVDRVSWGEVDVALCVEVSAAVYKEAEDAVLGHRDGDK